MGSRGFGISACDDAGKALADLNAQAGGELTLPLIHHILPVFLWQWELEKLQTLLRMHLHPPPWSLPSGL